MTRSTYKVKESCKCIPTCQMRGCTKRYHTIRVRFSAREGVYLGEVPYLQDRWRCTVSRSCCPLFVLFAFTIGTAQQVRAQRLSGSLPHSRLILNGSGHMSTSTLYICMILYVRDWVQLNERCHVIERNRNDKTLQ